MAVPSAQFLPEHIVVAIFHCLAPAAPRHASRPEDFGPGAHGRVLVALMGTCRAWRHALCPAFYGTALLPLAGKSPAEVWVRTVDGAIGGGCQGYIRSVRVPLAEAGEPGARGRHAIQCLESVGGLPSVRCVHLDVGMRYLGKGADSLARLERAGCVLDAVLVALARAAPGICRVEASDDRCSGAEMESAVSRILARTYRALGGRLLHIGTTDVMGLGRYWDVCTTAAEKAAAAAPAPLRSITIFKGWPARCGLELVQRFSESLERLHIESTCTEDVARMTVSDGRADRTHVYPRLRHIRVNRCERTTDAALDGPLGNPFPCLETLHFPGAAPFPVSRVLLENRARLRHVAVRLSRALAEDLLRSCAAGDSAAAGGGGGGGGGEQRAFARLHYLSLMVLRDNAATCGPVLRLLMGVAGACPHARTVRLRYTALYTLGEQARYIRPLPTVQQLDMEGIWLSVDEAADIAVACPRLLSASMPLMEPPERPGAEGQPPAASDVELRPVPATTLRTLLVRSPRFPSHRRTAQRILQLAARAPHLARVVVSSGHSLLPSRVIGAIGDALEEPPYKDRAHLHRIQFCVDNTK
ncbi:hypothetical protein H4R18_005296 [Coemansia javaensis]|uniref:Uncharacterized protein n=1 Tax=Coemansia javaensis TaxID=2761396 RepID=A0A9W8H2C8_9FUNG|nr:hypothetical protein H4R18_005296 [Coemansia javaensis]